MILHSFETKSKDERGIRIIPNKNRGKAEFKLYEDDGYTNYYNKVKMHLPKSEVRKIVINGKTFEKNNENVYEAYVAERR